MPLWVFEVKIKVMIGKQVSWRIFVIRLTFIFVLVLPVIFGLASCGASEQVGEAREVLVFVLDTGVDPGEVTDFERLSVLDDFYVGEHGTDTAKIIREECSDCRLISVSLGGEFTLEGEVVAESSVKTILSGDLLLGLLTIYGYLDNIELQSPDLEVAAIVNCSLGAAGYRELEHVIVESLSEMGVIIVAAAGNDGDDTLNYPAAHPEVIAVAAVANSNERADYSNYGSWIDIAALGHEIYECEGDILIGSGTSISAPRVAALLAEMLVRAPEVSPQEAVEVIKDTAVPIEGDSYYEAGCLGSGLINPREALDTVDPPTIWEKVRRALVSWPAIVVYIAVGLFSILWFIRVGTDY